MKLNLPNKLTVLRLILVPIFIVIGMLPDTVIPFYVSCVICAVLFIGTALTDMFDGKIARKHGLITDFGKFLDPVADKFMVIGALFVILYKFEKLRVAMIFVLIVIVFRELAVTSMRLVVSTGEGIVIAANSLGKIKTVSQIVFICTVFLEPVVEYVVELIVGGASNNIIHGVYPLTWLSMLFTVVMTLWSGINYIASYWKYLDPQK
ncbi:MAG: CDP-diacylglycerol--glycerol-3-phosphate 3-phosphatidyltransferase [Clostridia bacterium]|nr:CDP-diacylglycerol--glycerol-3-phosphate 3-phosphatidyltransferase [Clostridia bacterium]